MQKLKLIVLILIGLLAVSSIAYEHYNTPRAFAIPSAKKASFVTEPAPDIEFTTLDGKTYSLPNLKEDAVLLHFWASWCTTCIAEFPSLLKLIQSHNGKVALIAVSIDDKEKAMSRYRKRLKKDHPDLFRNPHMYWVWDVNKTLSLMHFNAVRVPETVFIDKNRLMVDKIAGEYNWSSDKTKQKIKALIKP